MYVDFKIDNSGDLIFEEKENNAQRISFDIAKTKTQKVTFGILDCYPTTHNNSNYLKIEFMINNRKSKNNTKIIKETEAFSQLLINKLKTTINTLPERYNFGSKLSTFKHQNINDSTLSEIKTYIMSLLKDDVPNLNVEVSSYINYVNGYNQAINIDIYNGNKFLLNHKIEG